MRSSRAAIAAITLGAVACPVFCYNAVAQSQQSAQSTPSAQAFVQDFYDWYTPRALSDPYNSNLAALLQSRAGELDPTLSRALGEDASSQDRETEYIVGLDYDPFLASQDPCDHYTAGEPRREGAFVAVPVYAVCKGRRHDLADVTAILAAKPYGGWQFYNFRYPDGPDLRSALKFLDAEHSATRPGPRPVAAEAKRYTLSLAQLRLARNETITSFSIRVQGGSIAAVLHVPQRWNLSITNTVDGSAVLTGVAQDVHAGLAQNFSTALAVAVSDPTAVAPFSVSGEVTIRSSVAPDRRLRLSASQLAFTEQMPAKP